MFTIDQEKVDGFKDLDQKESKLALADYAQNEFGVKLVRNKTFENMLSDLQEALDEKRAALPTDEELAAEPAIDFTPPAAPPGVKLEPAEQPFDLVHAVVKLEDEKTEDPNDGFKPAPEVLSGSAVDFVDPQANTVDAETLTSTSGSVNSEADNVPPGEITWMDGFSPTISLMGSGDRSNGYYTCPWWIFDWINQNPSTWYTHPEGCPQASAVPVLKSLAWYIKRDGQVTIRETRNSRFFDLKF